MWQTDDLEEDPGDDSNVDFWDDDLNEFRELWDAILSLFILHSSLSDSVDSGRCGRL